MKNITPADKAYFDIIDAILNYGEDHTDRTGVGTKRLFGHLVRFDLMESFPIITCKPASFKNTLAELIWFISGSTNVRDLALIRPQAKKWWQDFSINDNEDLGPMYGRQLTNFNGENLNQFHKVIEKIKIEPTSRRILMTSYNPLEVDRGALFPCHGLLTQFMVDNNNRLHMSTVQRSCDTLMGLQHNWVSYSLLLIMIAILTDKVPGTLTYYMNDLHIYNNHIDLIKTMERKSYSTPQLEIKDDVKNIEDFTMNHFKLINYKSGPVIKLPLAI